MGRILSQHCRLNGIFKFKDLNYIGGCYMNLNVVIFFFFFKEPDESSEMKKGKRNSLKVGCQSKFICPSFHEVKSP